MKAAVVHQFGRPLTLDDRPIPIVSEQGTAAIWGHDASSQAGQIIGQVAHPSVREELRQAARDLGFAGDWSRDGRAFSPGDR
jgi:Acetyl-CoA hydrolase/transferase C-terminal domain